MESMMVASLRASATFDFPLPRRSAIRDVQSRSLGSTFRVHMKRTAAWTRSVRVAQLPILEIRPFHWVRPRPSPIATELRELLAHCEQLLSRQYAQDRELKQLALENDVCRRLIEIPGVGPICALTFYAAISEPQRFRRSADVGAYLGSTPRIHQSGLTRRSGRISRMGNKDARHLLVHAAIRYMMCADPEAALRTWTANIEQRRGKGKSRVALARKLATVMLAIWKTGDVYRPKLVGAAA
jgi:transposase